MFDTDLSDEGSEMAAVTLAAEMSAVGAVPSAGPAALLGDALELVRQIDAEMVDTADEQEVIAALETVSRLDGTLTGCRSRLLARATETQVHRETGAIDTTQWFRDHTGISGRQAKDATRLAEQLTDMPGTARALDEGHLSAENASILARAAERGRLGGGRETEEALLAAARSMPPERLAREVRRREQEADDRALLEDERAAHRARSLTTHQRPDGSLEGRFRLPPDAAALFRARLAAFRQPDPKDCPPELKRSPIQRNADAFTDWLYAVTDPSPTVGAEPARLSVLVPYALLADADSHLPGETEFTGPLSAEACRRLACDGSVVRLVVSREGQVLNVGRETPKWTVAQRRAIVAMDGGCRFPGCDRNAGLTQVHHVEWYENGGTTNVDNGALLCVFHHHLVHEGGWRLTMDPATRRVTVVSPGEARILTSDPRGPTCRRATATREPDAGAASVAGGRSAMADTSDERATDVPVDTSSNPGATVRALELPFDGPPGRHLATPRQRPP